jgi:hypothetical protein
MKITIDFVILEGQNISKTPIFFIRKPNIKILEW